MKLSRFTRIEADLVLVSGLHIGAGDTEIHIGGIDNDVIKHPHTMEPFIPGSSIKGKLRSLLEWYEGVVGYADGHPIGISHLSRIEDEDLRKGAERIIRLFGISGGDASDDHRIAEIGPTRLSFWDCGLDTEWVRERKELGQSLTEAKSENTIDRIAGTARNPRQTERVPAGARFTFNLTIKKLDVDGDDLMDTTLTALKLLEYDSLGGSGSRGYGKVAFENMSIDGDDASARFAAVKPFEAAA